MTTKFCTSCQCTRSMEGGVTKQFKRGKRWICKLCLDKTAESIYKNRSGIPCDVEKLMNALYKKAA